jgi:hypothetical protein
MTQARHDDRVGLAHALLNGLCPGPARQTRHIWPSIHPHDNDGPRLSCRDLVRHPASFLSPLMPPPPRHPFLAEDVGAAISSPYSRPTPASTPTRAVAIARPRGYFTSCTHHRFRCRRTFRSSSRVLFFLPNLLPLPTVAATSRPTLVDAGTGESVLLLAFLRACC